ncbi:MAG: hypothetical protein QXX03_05615 [Nitrososphaerota archaeon]
MAILVKKITGDENTLYIQEDTLEKIVSVILGVLKSSDNPIISTAGKVFEKGAMNFLMDLKMRGKFLYKNSDGKIYKIILVR